MKRKVVAAIIGVVTTALVLAAQGRGSVPFSVVEAGIPEMQAALESGRVTSVGLVQQYLQRIATYEDRLNAVITINPKALDEADGT